MKPRQIRNSRLKTAKYTEAYSVFRYTQLRIKEFFMRFNTNWLLEWQGKILAYGLVLRNGVMSCHHNSYVLLCKCESYCLS